MTTNLLIFLSVVLKLKLINSFLQRNYSRFASKEIGIKFPELFQFGLEYRTLDPEVDWFAGTDGGRCGLEPRGQLVNGAVELGVLIF